MNGLREELHIASKEITKILKPIVDKYQIDYLSIMPNIYEITNSNNRTKEFELINTEIIVNIGT